MSRGLQQMIFIRHSRFGVFSGRFRKKNGRYWFYGDPCKEVRGRWDYLKSRGYRITPND